MDVLVFLASYLTIGFLFCLLRVYLTARAGRLQEWLGAWERSRLDIADGYPYILIPSALWPAYIVFLLFYIPISIYMYTLKFVVKKGKEAR